MPHDDTPKNKKKRRVPKVLRRLLRVLGLLFVLLAVLAAALPFMLSSNFARAKFVHALTEATGKPAAVDTMTFRWADGLRLEGLRIGQGVLSDESFLCSLARLRLDFGLPLRGPASLAVEVQGLRLRHRLGGETEPAPRALPLPAALRSLFASLRTGLKPMSLPVDAAVRVDLADCDLRLEQPQTVHALELRGLNLSLHAPSLKTAPVTLAADLKLVADGTSLGPVRLAASLDKLADASGRLTPAQTLAQCSLDLPGASLSSTGSLAGGLKLSLRADLKSALQPLRPLLAEGALPDLGGALALGLTLKQQDTTHLNAGVVLFLDGLRAARGPLGGKSFGPLSLNLLQEAECDLAAETVRLPGSLDFIGNGLRATDQARWLGLLDGVADGRPRLALSLPGQRLDLGALLAAARDFLPPGVSLGQASLELGGAELAALLPEASGKPPQVEASLKGLALSARNLQHREGKNRLSLGAAVLRVDAATLSLPAGAPGEAEAHLGADLDALRLTDSTAGPTSASVQKASLRRLDLRADTLALNPAALFGVTGAFALEQQSEARGTEAQLGGRSKVQVPLLTKEVRLRAELPADKSATASLDSFELNAPQVRVLRPGKAPVEAPLVLRLTAPEIRVSRAAEAAPLTPAVQGANLGLDLGGALHCSARLSLSGTGGRDVQSDGTLTLDAGRLLALAAALAPAQAKASGGLSVDWKLAASLPEQSKPAAAPKTEKLSQTLKRLGFLHQAEAVLALANLSLDWPLAATAGKPAEILRLRGITTPKPLRAATRDGVAESSLTGSVAFGPLDALPGLGRLSPPLRGLVTVNAAQQGARSVQFSELLRLDGREFEQNLSVALDKLDTVLDRDADRLAAVLELVDASVNFSLNTALQALPKRPAKSGASPADTARADISMAGTGRVEAGTILRLVGGHGLSVSGWLRSSDMDFSLGPDFSVHGLNSALSLDRKFSLASGLRCRDGSQADATPLSEQVFALARPAAPAARAESSLARVLSPGAPGAKGLGVLSLAQVKLKSGGLPLTLHDIELRLDTASPVPGLRSFRVGLLGGTVLGSALLGKVDGRYTLNADCAFSGIDPGRLLPAKTPRDLGSQAETAGRVSIELPLTPDPEELLQRLNLRADITKIGPRTLERMLYALDPEEQNETIVQQRRLMDIGYPRNLRLAVAYGNLSLSGAVEVKGFRLDLPPIDRLAVGNLPLRAKLKGPLSVVPNLTKLLDAVSGTQICRDPSAEPGALNTQRVVEPFPRQGATP